MNNLLRIDWHTAHFGYPTRTRFHTSGINERYIRVFFSNPDHNRGAPEIERPDASDTGRLLDVFFAINSRIRDNVHNNIVSDLSNPVFPENLLA